MKRKMKMKDVNKNKKLKKKKRRARPEFSNISTLTRPWLRKGFQGFPRVPSVI